MAELIEQTTPRARKEYRCNLCGCTIHKGEKYICQRCKDEGRIYSFRTHIACMNITDDLGMDELNEDAFSDIFDDAFCERYADEDGELLEHMGRMNRDEQVRVLLNDLKLDRYIVQLEPGVWVAPWEGDPGRTVRIENAKRFRSEKIANEALNAARLYRPFKSAKLIVRFISNK